MQLRDHVLRELRDHVLRELRDHVLRQLRDHVLRQLRDHLLRQLRDHVLGQLRDHVLARAWNLRSVSMAWKLWEKVVLGLRELARSQGLLEGPQTLARVREPVWALVRARMLAQHPTSNLLPPKELQPQLADFHQAPPASEES